MAYFDYSLPDVGSWSEGSKAIGDALTEVMRSRARRKEHEETIQMQQQIEARKLQHQTEYDNYLQGIENRKERMGEIDFNARQQERNAARMKEARHAANPQEAAAIAADTVTYDPHTGTEVSRGRLTPGNIPDVGPAPTAPVQPSLPTPAEALPDIVQAIPGAPPEIAARLRGKARPEPEAGAMVGPIPSADETKHAEIQRIAAEAPSENVPDVDARLQQVEAERADQEAKLRRFEAESQAYSQEVPPTPIADYGARKTAYDAEAKTFPQRSAAHAAEERGAERRRPYTLSLGVNDPGVTFDFETQRHGAAKEAADRFIESLAGIPMSEQDRAAASQIHAALLSGTLDPSKAGAAFQKERVGGYDREARGDVADNRNQTSIDVAKINASRPRASLQIGQGNLDMRQFEQFQKDAERLAKRYGVTQDVAGLKQLNDAVLGIGGDNQALQRGVAFQLTRSMQGSGPVTDKDLEVIRKDIAGKGGSLESWIEQADTGHLGPSEQKVLFDAIKIRLAGTKARMQQARAEADKHFLADKSPYRAWVGDDFIESELNSMFPGTASTSTPAGGPPEIAARRKGKTKVTVKASGSAVDDILNKYAPAKP